MSHVNSTAKADVALMDFLSEKLVFESCIFLGNNMRGNKSWYYYKFVFFSFLMSDFYHYSHCHLYLHSQPQLHHPNICTIPSPTQTQKASTALHTSASICPTGQRSSWTASNRWSWPGWHPCLSGERAPCRHGWRLSWRCLCIFAPAQKMSRVERLV